MLSFLTPYSGRYWSLLAALASETPAAILEDIRATSRLQAAP
jgi:hypothetical protein